ncbi:MAG: aminotransferase class III-fold pyridoxal phosphate-dependent enzyme [Spirochaetaceae bacterium]|jgi:glutamate-1-semialdehyde 2,1-aminomutase|nr:aminotransferase class III-fold pyridoxal phosphate-dependent enzyme [Spirochaetaceae bacterium]
MKTYSYPKSNEWFEKAKRIIPKGIHGHQGVGSYKPLEYYPIFSDHAEGTYFWDADGNKFLDFMCSYGPNILGYNDPDVNAAVAEQIKKEDCVSIPSYKMVEFAELMVNTISSIDWAFLAKNGGDVTNLAIAVAKIATGRQKIILVNGSYHGVAPWAQRPGAAEGIFAPEQQNNIYVDWNNLEQFERAIAENPGKIAGFISTPYYQPAFKPNQLPAEGYWKKVRELCTKNGIVLILDDVRCGFRMDLAGSDVYYGFEADLICMCKALANGFNVSTLMGKAALKEACEKIYFTGSYWLSAIPFAAGIACIKKLKKLDAAKHMLKMGKLYTDGLQKLAADYGYYLDVSAESSLFYLALKREAGEAWDYLSPMADLHKAWIAENVRRGVFLTNHHNHFTCAAVTEKDIQFALEVADDAFKAIKGKF